MTLMLNDSFDLGQDHLVRGHDITIRLDLGNSSAVPGSCRRR
jgi:hypothetical protein